MNGKEFLEDFDPQIKEVCYDNYSYTPKQVIQRLDAFKKQLLLHNVSQQRELLIDFCAKMEEKAKEYKHLVPSEKFIDEYLTNNTNKTNMKNLSPIQKSAVLIALVLMMLYAIVIYKLWNL